MQTREIKVVDWDEVRLEVKRCNKQLADIIDEINPGKRFKLIKATYLYGDLIVKDGMLQIPTPNNKLIPITDATADSKLTAKLGYSPIPLTLLLNKFSEVFVTDDSRAIPLNIIQPGKLFGTFEAVNAYFKKPSIPIWNVSVGARSIIMLPKVSEASGFKRLRAAFGISPVMQLKHMSDHWQVFKEIANHTSFTQPWISTVLIFPKEWIINNSEVRWFKFQRYFFEQSWQQSQFAIDQIRFGLFWQLFIKTITDRNLKPSPYLADTLKHLLLVATGGAPAFTPDDGSQLNAPTQGLQQVFIDVYSLKEYLPTIIYPNLLNSDVRSVYYSLAFPTLLAGSPNNKNVSTLMLDLKDIKLMIDTLLRGVSLEHNLIAPAQFEYFHVEEDKFKEIQTSKVIPERDARFLQGKEFYMDRSFCYTSPFWRGCIKLSLKDDRNL